MPHMAGTERKITVSLPEALAGRVRLAKGLVSEHEWVRDAIEHYLACPRVTHAHQPGPDVTRIRSSSQAKAGTGARPKAAKR